MGVRKGAAMEQPSDALQAALARLGVPAVAVRRASRHLVAIRRDLPTFETAWVDACLREGLLTRFQTDRLCRELAGDRSPSVDSLGRTLTLGPYILCELLQEDARTRLYAARDAERRPCELLVRSVEGDLDTERIASLQRIASRLENAAPRRGSGEPVWTRTIERADGRVVCEMPASGGIGLREVLIRRGRLSPPEVAGLLADLLQALDHVHREGVAHGDVRLERLRLAGRGGRTLRLLAPGVRSVWQPTITYRHGLPLAEADAIAPERIGTDRPADVASDLFGVGCVAWELLAGRPPFPQGGSLERLRAQRIGRVAPLGDYVEEVPPGLAELIARCLRSSPRDRPESAAAALRELGQPPRRRTGLAADSRTKRPAAGSPRRRRLTRSPVVQAVVGTAALLLLAFVGLTVQLQLADSFSPLRPNRTNAAEATAVGVSSPDATSRSAEAPFATTMAGRDAFGPVSSNDGDSLRPLPQPSPEGLLQLAPGTYRASELAWPGPLVVRAIGFGDRATDAALEGLTAREPTPRVTVLADGAWDLLAESIVLEGITVRSATSDRESQPLVRSRSQSFTATACRFEGAGRPAALTWGPLDAVDPRGRSVVLSRSTLTGGQAVLAIEAPARLVRLEDSVLQAAGPLVLWQHDWPRRETALQLVHSLVRGAASLVACEAAAVDRGQRLRVFLDHTVLHPTGERAAVVTIGDVSRLADVRRRVVVEQRGCVTSAAWLRSSCVGVRPAAADRLPIPQGELLFLGDRLDDATAPLPADAWPGPRDRETELPETQSPETELPEPESPQNVSPGAVLPGPVSRPPVRPAAAGLPTTDSDVRPVSAT